MSDLHTIANICRRLGPAQVSGRSALVCCPAHLNRRTPALSITQASDGRLLYYCHLGCSYRDIMRALEGLGHVNAPTRGFDPMREAAIAAQEREERKRRTARAQFLWKEAEPAAGTLVEAYLRQRSIEGAVPDALRFHPRAWHKDEGRTFPAMIARVDVAGEFVAVHRTYLAEPGYKAPVAQTKRMLGPTKGGAVRLVTGHDALLVAEGIETTLSAVEGLGRGWSAWAALSTSGMTGLHLPEQPARLAIAADNDTSGAGKAAAVALAARASAAGWSVKILMPPAPFKDWNDVAAAQAVGRAPQWA